MQKPLKLVTMTKRVDIEKLISKGEPAVDSLVPTVQEGTSTECSDIQVSISNLNKVNESLLLPELKTIYATSKGSSLQLFKYALQKKWKRETVRIFDGNVLAENRTPERKKEKLNISTDQERSSLVAHHR